MHAPEKVLYTNDSQIEFLFNLEVNYCTTCAYYVNSSTSTLNNHKV